MTLRPASLGWAGSVSLLALAALAAPAHADTLREALAAAYTTNPTLEGARASQRAVDEGVAIQRSQGLPSAAITATHIEFIQQSANAFTAPERNLGVVAAVLVPFYSGGAVRNGIAAAKERVEAGQADLRNTESTIFSQVVASYMDVLRTEALVALARNNVAVLRTNLEATSDRFQIGDLTITDVAQSRSRLAVAEGDLQGAEANLIAAREAYIRLVGNAPGELEAPQLLRGIQKAIAGGIKLVQLRAPNGYDPKYRDVAVDAVGLCAGKAQLMLKGPLEWLGDFPSAGWHLTAEQLRKYAPKGRPFPKERWLAASCHNPEELALAEQMGVDFVTLSPVQATATHPEAVPLGWEQVSAMIEGFNRPVYVLGGVGPADRERAWQAGAQGVAGIRAFWPEA